MNKIYSYCSYKQSPVGFQLGYANIVPEDCLVLLKDDKDSFVQRSFESGVIESACGWNPESDNYFYLIKSLRYTYENEDDYASTLYMNFAFEFENYNEYLIFLSGVRNLKSEELSDYFHEIIIPDPTDKIFALHINGKRLYDEIEKIKNTVVSDFIKSEVDTTYLHLHSKMVECAQIRELYGKIIDKEIDVFKKKEYEIVIKKKKSMKTSRFHYLSIKRVLSLIVVMISGVIALLILLIHLAKGLK